MTQRRHFIASLAKLAATALAVFALASASACANIVGDSCGDQTECGRQMFCELSLPGGYCTVRNCLDNGCPDEGVCIQFDDDTSYCMLACETNGDCRDDYRCVRDFGVHAFCNDADGPTPEVSE